VAFVVAAQMVVGVLVLLFWKADAVAANRRAVGGNQGQSSVQGSL
jgi:hypothetical protein